MTTKPIDQSPIDLLLDVEAVIREHLIKCVTLEFENLWDCMDLEEYALNIIHTIQGEIAEPWEYMEDNELSKPDRDCNSRAPHKMRGEVWKYFHAACTSMYWDSQPIFIGPLQLAHRQNVTINALILAVLGHIQQPIKWQYESEDENEITNHRKLNALWDSATRMWRGENNGY